MYKVTLYSCDADCISTEIIPTDEELFVEIAGNVLINLEEDSFPDDFPEKKLKSLIKLLKMGDWRKLLEPANEALCAIGNGEYYEIEKIRVPKPKVIPSLDEIIIRTEKAAKELGL